MELAGKIVAACLSHVWYQQELSDEPPTSLAQYSLRELLEANALVATSPRERDEEKKTTTIALHCDDRLIAALYVLYHYPASRADDLDAIAINPKAVVLVLARQAESVPTRSQQAGDVSSTDPNAKEKS